ncbi:MAG: fluoride efflux transporter CrcB [Candidatus Schekmanbacteria bacterium]|nr:MAG: fluoride efflux transporter CrcB [Candidatus Schekmanbacteria bacterium]
MIKVIMLVLGGGAGAVARYSLAGFISRIYPGLFPAGTMVVNLAGSFLIGLLWGFSEIFNISPNTRTFIFIGFLGSFTTFSTFALESVNLIRDNEKWLALINIFLSNAAAIILVFLGFFIAKAIGGN